MPNNQELYAKDILKSVFPQRFSDDRSITRRQQAPDAANRIIDGVLDSDVAVEISSGTAKQIAGDGCLLALDELPFKLLVVVPSGSHNADTASALAEICMRRILRDDSCFRVVRLHGHAGDRQEARDQATLRLTFDHWPSRQ